MSVLIKTSVTTANNAWPLLEGAVSSAQTITLNSEAVNTAPREGVRINAAWQQTQSRITTQGTLVRLNVYLHNIGIAIRAIAPDRYDTRLDLTKLLAMTQTEMTKTR